MIPISSCVASTTCVTMKRPWANGLSGSRLHPSTAAVTSDAKVVRTAAVPTAKWTLLGI